MFAPSSFAKSDMLNHHYPILKESFVESMKILNTWFDESHFVNVDTSARWPVVYWCF